MRDRSDHLAAIADNHFRGVTLQGMAERVIGGQEKPGIAAAFDHLLRGADGKGVGVEHPLHRIGRAELAVEIGRAGRMGDEELLAIIGHLLNRQADRRNRHVDNQVDVIDVVPLPCNARADIGLDLVVGGNHRDRLAQDLAAEILDRHLRRRDRAGAGRGCRRARRGRSAHRSSPHRRRSAREQRRRKDEQSC